MVTRSSLPFVPLCVACLFVLSLSGCGGSKPQEAPKTAPTAAEAVASAVAPVAATPAAPADAPPAPEPMPVSDVPLAPAPTPEAVPAPPAPAPPAVPAAAAAPATPAAGGAPKISCEAPVFDFGSTEEETINHGFVLRNIGSATLEITNIKAACGCTTTQLDTMSLEPGREVTLNSVLSLKGRQGKQTKTIAVETNDPETPVLTLTLTGTAIPSITVDPENLNLGRIEDDEPRSTTFTVKANKEGLSFKLVSVEVDGLPFMEHSITEVEPGKEYRVDLNSNGPIPVGMHTGRIVVRTDTLERPVLWVSINMQVVGAVMVMPPQINLRQSDNPEDMESQQISISPGRVREYKLREVTAPAEGINVEVLDVGNHQYRVKLSNIPRTMDLDGKDFVVRLDDAANTEVKIPVRVFRLPTNRTVVDGQKKPAAVPHQPINPLPEDARSVVVAPPQPVNQPSEDAWDSISDTSGGGSTPII